MEIWSDSLSSVAGLSLPSPPEAGRVCLRLRLHAVWEAARCALDAEPGVPGGARQALLVQDAGHFAEPRAEPLATRYPLLAFQSDSSSPERAGLWEDIWQAALAALSRRRPHQGAHPGDVLAGSALSGNGVIAEDSPGGEQVVDVYLPFLARTEYSGPKSLTDSLEIRVDEFDRVRVRLAESGVQAAERLNFEQTALLLAEALPRPAGPPASAPALHFGDVRRLSRPQLLQHLPWLLKSCGLAPEPDFEAIAAAWPEGAEVSVTLSLPGAPPGPWFEAPRQRSPEYYEAFGRVSLAIQNALRAWLPYLFFSDLSHYGDPETAYPMLAYQASRPFARKGSPEFTYDVMNPESIQRALRTAGARLAELIESAGAVLAGSGCEALARRYQRLEARAVLDAVKRSPRAFQGLLAAEACFVGEVIKLALGARLLREEPAQAPRRLYRLVAEFTGALHHRLRRIYRGLCPVSLGSLVLIEASRALSLSYGLAAPLWAVVRLRAADGREQACRLVRDEGGRTSPEGGPI